MCVFAGSLPREVDIDIYARLIRELRGSASRPWSTPTATRCARRRAEPDVVSPNVLEAEELVGHEFNDDEDRLIAVREMVGLGAREAMMTMPDGCFAQTRRRAERPPVPVPGPRRARSGRAARHRRLRRRVPGRLRRRPLQRRVDRGLPRVRRRLRRRNPQHLGAGLVDPDRVHRLLGEIQVERPEYRPRSG